MTADKLVQAYIKMRDVIATIDKERDEKVESIKEKMKLIETALMALLDKEGIDSVQSEFGSARKAVTTKYWVPDWDAFRQFVADHQELDLLQRNLHQGNLEDLMNRRPDLAPPVSSTTTVTVRVTRSRKK
jgi:hypothetical protein